MNTASITPRDTVRRKSALTAGQRTAKVTSRLIVGSLLAVYAVVSIFPFAVMVGGALKTNQQIISNPLPFTSPPTLQTLADTFDALNVPLLLFNSLVLAIGACLLVLLVYPLAGYAFAVLRFPFKRTIFAVFVGVLFVPGVTVLLPVVILDQNLGLYGSPLAVILPHVNGSAAIAIILMRAYYATIPTELHEAAVLDGCSEFSIFARIYFPLSRSALITLTILTFVGSWNEYVLPVLTNDDPNRFPLPVGLQSLLSSNVVQWNQVMAAALIIVVPIIILFVFLQRYFINGLQGSVKG
ncbi:multiple sugar transport system permease protein [Arthrobacter pigmenti]|uniref:Multiple sugar transport system permease protein n=1 Tax=Arthrobacter pigmenti TaxID=271432 RepID=A0A846RY31_9MICC|nr:carbohydrate ABC transporter permease [Arthrobacter pigmenti]NJC24465.1 multiple sugar transport system permease protein [Arthrobacter pigmenti]